MNGEDMSHERPSRTSSLSRAGSGESACLIGGVDCCVLFDENPMMLFIVDKEGVISSANHFGAALLGYSPGELIGRPVLDIFHEEDRNTVKRHMEESLREPDRVTFWEVRKVRKDGSVIWVKEFARTLASADRKPRIYIACEDITDRKRAEEALKESEEHYRELVESANSIILKTDPLGRITFFNEFARKFFGYTGDEIMGKNIIGTITPVKESTGRDLSRMINDVLRNPDRYEVVVNENVRKNGEHVWVSWTNKVMRDSAGKFIGILSIGSDISERKRVEERASFFSSAIENSSQPFVALYPDGCIMQFNSAYVELTGYRPDELYRMTMMDLTPSEYHDYEEIRLEELRRTGRPHTYQKEYLRKDGTRVPLEVKVHLAADAQGRPEYYYAFVADITERKKMEAEISHMAHHDPLTGLPNRRLFMNVFSVEIAQARRNRKKLAILFLDLDRFKEINDTLGHEAGDGLLKSVAARLKTKTRQSDTIARIGGDEFSIILADIAHTEGISHIARKILKSFREPFIVAGHELSVTTSMGISVYPDDDADMERLLRCADIAMYYAKRRGGDNYQFYNPSIHIRSIERMMLESGLRRTLEHGELTVYYQPQVEISSRRMIAAEALIRWRHPEMGLLLPERFISAAEATGFISAIDEWVLETVCKQVRAWLDAGLPPVCITVNISEREFNDPGLAGRISGLLESLCLSPGVLYIEISENMAMSDIERSAARLHELEERGVHASIDGFGTGYSSLSFLKRLPVRKLKIARSLIRDISENPDNRAVVKAAVAVAHTLQMRVLAEGVETDEQLSFLDETDCDEAQGFLFSEPMPAEQFSALIVTAT